MKANVTVAPNLPDDLKVGFFKGKPNGDQTYKAWIRFSNAADTVTPDTQADFRGMAIKMFGVSGERLPVPGDEDDTQDLLFIGHDAFFAGSPQHFLDFLGRAIKAAARAIRAESLRGVAPAHPPARRLQSAGRPQGLSEHRRHQMVQRGAVRSRRRRPRHQIQRVPLRAAGAIRQARQDALLSAAAAAECARSGQQQPSLPEPAGAAAQRSENAIDREHARRRGASRPRPGARSPPSTSIRRPSPPPRSRNSANGSPSIPGTG